MQTIYIIAHTWELVDMTIELYFTPESCVKRMGEIFDDGFGKPTPDTHPQEYLNAFDEWDADGYDKNCMMELEIFQI